MKDKILILSGDPNSINSEIICKSWKKLNNFLKQKIYLISNYDLFKKQIKKLNFKIKLVKVDNIDQKVNENKLKIINIDLKYNDPFNVEKKNASKFINTSLNFAHKLALDKKN